MDCFILFPREVDGQVYPQVARQKKKVVFNPQIKAVEETDGNMDGDVANIDLSIRGSLTNLALQAKGRKVRRAVFDG